jgi:hypothetical protein
MKVQTIPFKHLIKIKKASQSTYNYMYMCVFVSICIFFLHCLNKNGTEGLLKSQCCLGNSKLKRRLEEKEEGKRSN